MNLDSNVDPDYGYIEILMKRAADDNGIKIDWHFDWHGVKKEEGD